MKKFIIVSMLLFTLLLVSCTQKEESKSEESKETASQQQNEVITKNNIKTEDNLMQKESGEMMDNNSIMNNDSTMMDNNSMMNETRIIKIDAKKWEYSKKEIRVKKGEKVIIRINNVDVTHGIAIPGMKLVGDEEVILDTSKIGIFEFRCANYCGSGHSTMEGKIIIE